MSGRRRLSLRVDPCLRRRSAFPAAGTDRQVVTGKCRL